MHLNVRCVKTDVHSVCLHSYGYVADTQVLRCLFEFHDTNINSSVTYIWSSTYSISGVHMCYPKYVHSQLPQS